MFIAPSEVLTAKVLCAQVKQLQVGANGTVKNEDSFPQRSEVRRIINGESLSKERAARHGDLRLQVAPTGLNTWANSPSTPPVGWLREDLHSKRR